MKYYNICYEMLMKYQNTYYNWKDGNYSDYRRLFCNMYAMLREAVLELKDVDSIYIWNIFVKEFNKDCKLLDDLMR